MSRSDHIETPDGRYFIVRGRLWRLSNPNLPESRREELVSQLMIARRSVKEAMGVNSKAAEAQARRAVDRAKRSLGERGPVWWDDGAPDYNRHMVQNTPYADWYKGLFS